MQANPSDPYDFSEFQKHEEDPPAVESCDQSSSTFPFVEEVAIEDELIHDKSGVVYIKTLGEDIFSIPADPEDLIKTIREKVQKKIKVPLRELNLLHAGRKLEDDKALSHYGIPDKATIHLLLGASDPNQITLECHTQLAEGQCEINLLYQNRKFPLKIQVANRKVKDLKGLVFNKVHHSDKEFVLLHGGMLLLEEEKALTEFRIVDQSNIIVIPTSDGGDCLKFPQLVLGTVINDLAHLESSLDFLQVKERIKRFFRKAQNMIKNIKKTKPKLINASEEGLAAVMLWTSNIVYGQLNQDLRGNDDFSKWNVYLKSFLNGLKAMPCFRGTVFRGFKNYKDLNMYQKGKLVTWKTVSALSKDKKTAEEFSNEQGTVFEVEVFSARDISSISVFPKEDEVIMPPHSCFEVIDVIETSGKSVYIKLREVPTSRARKQIFCTDANPENNYSIAKKVGQKSISCVFCVSTKDALDVFEKYRWLLYFENKNCKIITDMIRDQDGVVNYSAGLALVEKLVRDHQEDFEVFICCGDV